MIKFKTKNRREILFYSFASFFLFSPLVSAQEPPNSSSGSAPVTIDADDVLVTSSRTKGVARKSERSVRVISAKDIEQTTAANVGELFADIPGVSLTDTGMAGMKRILVRGETASRTLVVIDGIKSSDHRSGGSGSPILIDVASIERIEIISGSASVLYGSEAIGGIVNIITKKGGTKPIQADAGVGYDSSSNLVTTKAAIYGSAGGFDYRFAGSYTDAGNRRTAGGVILPSTEFDNYSLNNYLGYRWEDGGVNVRHQSFRSSSNLWSPRGVMRMEHWDRDRVSLGIEQFDLGSISKFSLTGAYQRSFKDFRDPASRLQNTQHEAHALFQMDFEFPWDNHFITGVDYSFTFLDSHKTANRTGIDTFYQVNENNLGLFAHNKWQIIPDFALLAGLRYSYVQANLKATNDVSPLSQIQNQALIGSFGFLYDIGEVANLRFHYGNGFKSPEMDKVFVQTVVAHGGPVVTVFPNRSLKPEFSHNFEVGFRYFSYGFDIDTAFAYNLGSDYILSNRITPNSMTYLNMENSHSFSSELKLSYKIPFIELVPYFNGSYQYTHLIDHEFTTNRTGIPPWQLKSGLRFEREISPIARLRADANIVYNSQAQLENRAGTIVTFNPWYTLNASVGFTFSKDDLVQLNGGMNNILDAQYRPTGLVVPVAGRHFFVNLNLKL